MSMTLQETLKHHVTGAIERGEAQAITAIEKPFATPFDSYACEGETVTGTLAGHDLTARPDFDYTCECGYYVCEECGAPSYPMEVEDGECPACMGALVFHPHGGPCVNK